jgi:PAS domain S-box-containing protein
MTHEVLAPDFRKIFETAPGHSLVLMPDSPRFTIIAVSDSYLKVTLKERKEIVGHGFFEVFSKNADLIRHAITEATSTLSPAQVTEYGHEFQGSSQRSAMIPVIGQNHQVLYLLHSLEVTPTLSAEYNQIILESLTDHAVYLLDASGRILSWNVGVERIKGYKPSDTIGKSFSIFYSVEEVKDGKPSRDLRTAERQGKFEEETLRLTKDGKKFWASVVISAVHDERGKLKGFVKMVSDISQRRDDALALLEAKEMLEARVKQRTQDLTRSNTELEQFAYIASHDLQTPLRHISSYVQLLTNRFKGSELLDAKAEKWVGYILSGTQQMRRLISDLLSYSRIGRVDMHVEEINTTELLAHITEELKEVIRSANAQIIFREVPKIFGIKSQIEQLFQNLIENAIKFKRPDIAPIVTILCKDNGDSWAFSVSDNGIGIESKYSERIFLMFHRLHSVDQYAGTGIGLAICKKIIDFHGGKIGLDPAAETGATFRFVLPKKVKGSALAGSPDTLTPDTAQKRLSS